MKFMRTMIEEKNLMDITFEVSQDGTFHHIPMGAIIEFVENSPEEVIDQVNSKLSEIDFNNGDVLDFVKHLAMRVVEL